MDEEEIPEWEVEDEKIPPSLEEKWRKDEEKGLGASLCKGCGTLLMEDQLSCPVCHRKSEVQAGLVSGMAHWFFKTPWGIVTFLIILPAGPLRAPLIFFITISVTK